jgi:hypothetical protein
LSRSPDLLLSADKCRSFDLTSAHPRFVPALVV